MDEFLFLIAEFVELSKSFENILNLDRFTGNFDQKIHFLAFASRVGFPGNLAKIFIP